MFGGPKNSATPPPNSGRPQAGDVAKITGNLTHVFVTEDIADNLSVFYNGTELMTGQIESLSLEIVAPGEDDGGKLTAILSRYQNAADGTRTLKTESLFPGTVDIIAKGRRLSVTCEQEGSFEGLYLRFGTENAGVGLEANGVQSLRVLVTSSLLDGRLTWSEDGREDILLS